MKSPQFWSIFVLLIATMFLLHARGDVDHVPPSAPLNEVPDNFGHWVGQEIPISAETLEILGKGDFLNRVYTFDGAGRSTVPAPAANPKHGACGPALHRVLSHAADGAGDSFTAELSSGIRLDVSVLRCNKLYRWNGQGLQGGRLHHL